MSEEDFCNSKIKLVIFLTFIITINSSIPFGICLNQNELDVDVYCMTYELTKGYIPPFQGDSREIYLNIKSSCSNEVMITWVGIHFEWMDENYYYQKDLSDDPIILPSGGGTEMLDTLTYSVPIDALIGENEAHFRINGKEKGFFGWSDFTWNSQTFTWSVRDKNEKIFTKLRSQVRDELNSYERTRYESEEAQKNMQNAEVAFEIAIGLGDSELWSQAVSKLNEASEYISKADIAERAYREAKESSSSTSSSSKSSSASSSSSDYQRSSKITSTGIPGFKSESIIIGLVLVTYFIKFKQ